MTQDQAKTKLTNYYIDELHKLITELDKRDYTLSQMERLKAESTRLTRSITDADLFKPAQILSNVQN